jgi:hypothetical protein
MEVNALKRIPLVALFAILALSTIMLGSCSKDDDPAGPDGGGSSNPDDARVDLVVNDIVLPLMQNIFLGSYLIPPGRETPDRTVACEPLEFCAAGSAEACINPGSFQLNFSGCQIGPAVLSGMVELTTQTNSGSGSMSLTVGGSSAGQVTISGNLSYDYDGTCFGQYITDTVISTSNLTMNMAGFANWCDPYAMVNSTVIPTFAQFEFVIPAIDRLIDVTIFTEPAGDMEILVLNASRTKIYRICHGKFTQGSQSCSAGPDA